MAQKEAEPEFASLGDRARADAMTDYLDTLDERDRERWGKRTISVSILKNSAQLLVDGRPWSTKLDEPQGLFLLAYHYAWLKLSRTEPFTYPGFVLLDFPANLGEFAISDQENYLLTPLL